MKRLFLILALLPLLASSCNKQPQPNPGDETTIPSYAAGEKQGHITYQLLIYSFADSDGDGIGDFNGIKAHLDYLDALGVSAIWLSPAHPADSYHGYDVTDYSALNPKYGTEADFKALLDAAHAKGIKIYMDYVLNHTGKGHPWFAAAKKSESSSYFNWYNISANPAADYAAGKFPTLNGYYPNEWHDITVGDVGYKGRLFSQKSDCSEIDSEKRNIIPHGISCSEQEGAVAAESYNQPGFPARMIRLRVKRFNIVFL